MLNKLIFITCLGAVLEFLDFTIVMLFANELTLAFLPDAGKSGLLWLFAIYSLGSLSRPIGGLLFSHYGDKIGRKQLFRLSIIMMSGATLGIGLLPGYSVLGLTAVVLLAILRTLQGLSVGGELPGAIVFAAEHVPPRHRGALTAAIIASALLGLVLASFMGVVIQHSLSTEQINSWGWRLPFITGSLLGIIGYYLRKGLVETPLFSEIMNAKAIAKTPLATLFKGQTKAVFIGVGLTATAASMVSIYILLPSYASRYLGFPAEKAFEFTTVTLLTLSILTLACGWLSDRVGRKPMLITSGILLLLIAQPAYEAMMAGSLWIMMALTIIPAAVANGCYVSSVSELFPTQVRYTGLAVCINVGVCVFGGCVPYMMELLNQSGYSHGPLMLMLITGTITVVSSWAMAARHGCSLGHIESLG